MLFQLAALLTGSLQVMLASNLPTVLVQEGAQSSLPYPSVIQMAKDSHQFFHRGSGRRERIRSLSTITIQL